VCASDSETRDSGWNDPGYRFLIAAVSVLSPLPERTFRLRLSDISATTVVETHRIRIRYNDLTSPCGEFLDRKSGFLPPLGLRAFVVEGKSSDREPRWQQEL
jgi:hypothetical protein